MLLAVYYVAEHSKLSVAAAPAQGQRRQRAAHSALRRAALLRVRVLQGRARARGGGSRREAARCLPCAA